MQRPPAPSSGASLRPSSPGTASVRAAPQRSSASAAASSSNRSRGIRRSSPRDGSSASAGSGPGLSAVVCLEGLGRYERGLARDLGLCKLAAALWGRFVEAEETDVLLAPYGEWAGLASVYLLAGFHHGLVRLPDARAA